ncbi:MAG TPA: HEPN domain-containing protein [Thermoleophilaceae bacterium]|nr:HEPN domain-containing protein [Thermoleophilaceae bacterium]
MTRAKVREVEPDSVAAAELIAQARAHLDSARLAGIDAQSAYGICYQAALKAMVAALLADGRRVTSGAGGHIVTIQEAEARLALDPTVSVRIDHMRRTRHRVFYDGHEVSELELEGALADAEAVVAAAAEAVDA